MGEAVLELLKALDKLGLQAGFNAQTQYGSLASPSGVFQAQSFAEAVASSLLPVLEDPSQSQSLSLAFLIFHFLYRIMTAW